MATSGSSSLPVLLSAAALVVSVFCFVVVLINAAAIRKARRSEEKDGRLASSLLSRQLNLKSSTLSSLTQPTSNKKPEATTSTVETPRPKVDDWSSPPVDKPKTVLSVVGGDPIAGMEAAGGSGRGASWDSVPSSDSDRKPPTFKDGDTTESSGSAAFDREMKTREWARSAGSKSNPGQMRPETDR